jgi:mutator protein MutT
MAKTAKAVIEVGSAIIQRDGKYLVSQRPEGSHLGQVWEFPGGKREAATLGIEISVGRLWRVVERQYPERIVRLHFFLCQLTSGTPRAIGCQRFRWIQPGEFGNFEFPPADLDIIQELARKAQRAAVAAAVIA